MKPTDEERRKVAERLMDLTRGYLAYTPACSVIACGELPSPFDDVMYACKVPSTAHASEICKRLADLIEPEERTCTFVYDDGEGEFKCDACGEFVTQHDTWEEYCVTELTAECFDYCPFCGAKVVD